MSGDAIWTIPRGICVTCGFLAVELIRTLLCIYDDADSLDVIMKSEYAGTEISK